MRDTSYLWVEELSPEYLDTLVQKIESEYPLVDARVGDGTSDPLYRSTKIAFILKDTMPEVWELGREYITEANCVSYNFDITRVGDCQFTVYNSSTEDFYDWHTDTRLMGEVQDRKITMVVQLSDSEDHEGGDLEFNFYNTSVGENYPIRTRGTILTFPSFIPHRVTPVTKGIRKSLVFWMEGPAFR